MIIRRFVRVSLLISLWSLSAQLYASGPETVRIEIKSSWGGLGTPADGFLRITGNGRRFTSNDGRVNSSAVHALIASMERPIVERPSLTECGITQDWLAANYRQALERYTHEKIRHLSVKQVELFKERFTNLADAQAAFDKLFEGWHTDDYPKMSVTVSLPGRRLGIQSESQHAFMLPWFGTDATRGGLYDCQISRSIAAILPKGFPNRERLIINNGFRWELTDEVMRSIDDEWHRLGAEFKVGPAVAPVVARYRPLKSAISDLNSIDLDRREAWNAELRSSDIPINLIIGVSLRYRNKKLSGVDQLLTDLPKYSDLVLSVPWLTAFLKAHPEVITELRYVEGRSLSVKAEASLIDDLRKHGKADLAETVSKDALGSAFLEIIAGAGCWSTVVVLPDHKVILWHFKCESVLGLPARDFETWDYYGWRGAGVLIEEDGTMAK